MSNKTSPLSPFVSLKWAVLHLTLKADGAGGAPDPDEEEVGSAILFLEMITSSYHV